MAMIRGYEMIMGRAGDVGDRPVVVVGASKSMMLSCTSEVVEVSSSDGSLTRAYEVGRCSWTCKSSGFVVADGGLPWVTEGSPVMWCCWVEDDALYFRGYIESVEWEGDHEGMGKCTVKVRASSDPRFDVVWDENWIVASGKWSDKGAWVDVEPWID